MKELEKNYYSKTKEIVLHLLIRNTAKAEIGVATLQTGPLNVYTVLKRASLRSSFFFQFIKREKSATKIKKN